MNDQKIVDLLRSKKKDKAFLKLYKYYPKVEKLILSKGGSKADASDTYQEALIIFYKKVMSPDFKLTSAIGTYLYSVCRFLWKDELRRRKKDSFTDLGSGLSNHDEQELQEAIEKEKKIKVVEQILTQLGDRCLELLKSFYYEAMRMKEIASRMGFSSEKVAKNQKYKCLERAKLQLKEMQHEVNL